MTDFEYFKLAYQLGWCTQSDLQQAVTSGLITQDQMNQILAG